jgi:hypothetical protein
MRKKLLAGILAALVAASAWFMSGKGMDLPVDAVKGLERAELARMLPGSDAAFGGQGAPGDRLGDMLASNPRVSEVAWRETGLASYRRETGRAASFPGLTEGELDSLAAAVRLSFVRALPGRRARERVELDFLVFRRSPANWLKLLVSRPFAGNPAISRRGPRPWAEAAMALKAFRATIYPKGGPREGISLAPPSPACPPPFSALARIRSTPAAAAAKELAERLAERGNALAAVYLEMADPDNASGWRAVAVRGKAMEALAEGAGSGFACAENELAAARYLGLAGVRPDPEEAFRLYLSAARKGYPRGQVMAGRFYLDAIGGAPESPYAAEQWFRQAAEGGSAEGMTLLAMSLVEARGVDPDVRQGLEWLDRAIASGSEAAMRYKAAIYADGVYVRRDAELAARLMREAAEAERAGGDGAYDAEGAAASH